MYKLIINQNSFAIATKVVNSYKLLIIITMEFVIVIRDVMFRIKEVNYILAKAIIKIKLFMPYFHVNFNQTSKFIFT